MKNLELKLKNIESRLMDIILAQYTRLTSKVISWKLDPHLTYIIIKSKTPLLNYDKKIHSIYVFHINDEIRNNLFIPFYKGKYSQISKQYIDNVPNTYYNKPNINKLILTRSFLLKALLENILGTKISDDAELWEKPRGYRSGLPIKQLEAQLTENFIR